MRQINKSISLTDLPFPVKAASTDIYTTLSHICTSLSETSALADVAFLDIETTGLSPINNHIFIIGLSYIDASCLNICQYFADTPDDESAILTEALLRLSRFKAVVTYNGNTFDLPFIKKRCDDLNIDATLPASLDLYKHIKGLSRVLNLDNLKQQTIEQYLSIYRADKLVGRAIIKLYREYVLAYKLKDDTELMQSMLLEHNYEDIISLPAILSLLAVQILPQSLRLLAPELSCTDYTQSLDSKVFAIELRLSPNQLLVPKPLAIGKKAYCIELNNTAVAIKLPVIEGELKHFYSNYKDYYYLPLEDTAMHKSIAAYVDKSMRQRATKDTCYTRTRGHFIYCNNADNINLTAFKQDYDANEEYALLKDIVNDADTLIKLATQLIEDAIN